MWGNICSIFSTQGLKGLCTPSTPHILFYLTKKGCKKVKACLKAAGSAVDSSRVFPFDGSGFFSSVISTYVILSWSTAMAAAARQSGEFVLLGVLSF
jgi:hypothetical protein